MGVSKLLMETVFKNARLLVHNDEPMNIFLSTSEFQAPAIQLYKNYGFNWFTDVGLSIFPGVTVVAHFFHRSLNISC